jgi:YndJ-like protein
MTRNVMAGFTAWLVMLKVMTRHYGDITWIEALFLFAPLVIVPLGLELTARMEQGIVPSWLERFARAAQLPAALCATAAFLFMPGRIAASLAAVYAAFCAALGLAGLLRIFRGGWRSLDAAAPAVAFVSLPVAGVWLVASRLAMEPMGFHEPFVLLTAVHFHYAGFAAAMLVRPVARLFAGSGKGGFAVSAFRAAAIGALAGPIALAIGFLYGPRWKFYCTTLLALSETGLAIAFLAAFGRVQRRSARALIACASASVAASMIFAVLWAYGEFHVPPQLRMATMVNFHGTMNALGFALCGLAGWTLAFRDGATSELPSRGPSAGSTLRDAA